jgi:hypothetical protein
LRLNSNGGGGGGGGGGGSTSDLGLRIDRDPGDGYSRSASSSLNFGGVCLVLMVNGVVSLDLSDDVDLVAERHEFVVEDDDVGS